MSFRIRLGIIALLPSYYQDKIWIGLAKRGDIDIKVIYLSDVGVNPSFRDITFDTVRDWADRIRLDAYEHEFLKNYGDQNRPGPFFRVNPGLIPLLVKSRFDAILLHGHTTVSTLAAALVCELTGTQVIYRGEAIPTETDSQFRRRLKARFDGAMLRRFDVVMYSCTGNRNYFEARGVPTSKLLSIPCAVENSYYRAQYDKWHPLRTETRKAIGIGMDDVVVVFLGRLIPCKRVHEIPLVAACLRAIAPSIASKVHWLVVGEGPERATIERAIREQKADNVHMVGWQDQHNLGKYLAAADIGLLLSDYDASPKSLNEMMNFGLALLCTEPAGTAFDLVRHGRNGFVVPVGRPEEIAQFVAHIVDEGRIEEMGRESLRIVERYTLEADVEAIAEAAKRASRAKARRSGSIPSRRKTLWGRLSGG